MSGENDFDSMNQNTSEDDQQEYQRKKLEKQQRAQNEQETGRQIEQLLRQVLDSAAKERLSNVRLVNPELYLKTTQAILYLMQNKQITGKISEQQLKQLLERFSQKRETTIKRK